MLTKLAIWVNNKGLTLILIKLLNHANKRV